MGSLPPEAFEEKGSSTYSKGHLFTKEERFLHSECKRLTSVLILEGASESPGNLTIHQIRFYWAPTTCQACEHICDWMYIRISLFSSALKRGLQHPPQLRPPSATGRDWVRWKRKCLGGGTQTPLACSAFISSGRYIFFDYI